MAGQITILANGEDLCERPGSKDFWDKMVWHCDPELAESVPVCSLRRSETWDYIGSTGNII